MVTLRKVAVFFFVLFLGNLAGEMAWGLTYSVSPQAVSQISNVDAAYEMKLAQVNPDDSGGPQARPSPVDPNDSGGAQYHPAPQQSPAAAAVRRNYDAGSYSQGSEFRKAIEKPSKTTTTKKPAVQKFLKD